MLRCMTLTPPPYADLPVRPGLPKGSSWGVWGDDDRLGCLNLLSPEGAKRGAGLVRSGNVHPLNLELELPDPPLFGRPAFGHEVVSRPSGISCDDMLHGWNTQSSSQWDGFRMFAVPPTVPTTACPRASTASITGPAGAS